LAFPVLGSVGLFREQGPRRARLGVAFLLHLDYHNAQVVGLSVEQCNAVHSFRQIVIDILVNEPAAGSAELLLLPDIAVTVEGNTLVPALAYLIVNGIKEII
jgi:hypothetical protein